MEYGADFSLKDSDGDTALELATRPEIKQAILCKLKRSITDRPTNQPAENQMSLSSLGAHSKHCAGLRLESNSRSSRSPSNSPTGHNFITYKTKEENEELIDLRTELEIKSELLNKMVLDMKMWRSNNEQLELRVKSLEEEIQQHDLTSHIGQSTIVGDGLGKRWWLLNKADITNVSEEVINVSSTEYQRFFNVHLGTFRMMKVAVKKCRNAPKWDEMVYKTFLKEMEILRYVQT